MTAIELTDQQADDWLARVEDPKTKRAEKRLRDSAEPDAMCCLGHLADILDPEVWKALGGRWSWAGNHASLPRVTYRGLPLDQGFMAHINDYEHRFPATEIREWIEKARAQ